MMTINRCIGDIDVQQLHPSAVVDACSMASSRPPQEWDQSILLPLKKEPVSIFGHAQVPFRRDASIPIIEALVHTGLSPSLTRARESVKTGAVRVNGVRETSVSLTLDSSHILPNLDAIVIECGKRNYGILEAVDP